MTDITFKDLRRVDVRPGDRFVLVTEQPLTVQQARDLQAAWKAWADPLTLKLLALPRGMRLMSVDGELLVKMAEEQGGIAPLEVSNG